MPAKASPSVQLRYVQRPVFYREAPGGLQDAAAPASIRGELSMEAQASVTVTGATISASEGDLTLPWLGQLGSFFAIGEQICPGSTFDTSLMRIAHCRCIMICVNLNCGKAGKWLVGTADDVVMCLTFVPLNGFLCFAAVNAGNLTSSNQGCMMMVSVDAGMNNVSAYGVLQIVSHWRVTMPYN